MFILKYLKGEMPAISLQSIKYLNCCPKVRGTLNSYH